jgi:formiminotetrahydrofolate cyclodeaminase
MRGSTRWPRRPSSRAEAPSQRSPPPPGPRSSKPSHAARSGGSPDGASRFEEIVGEADAARPVLLASADRDAEALRATIEAYRLPHDDGDARTHRLRVLQEALEAAIDVQLDLARRSVYLLGLAEEVTRDGDENAAADGVSAAAALHAATTAAVANAEINAFAIADPGRRDELMDTCAALRDRAAMLLADAQGTFRDRIALA